MDGCAKGRAAVASLAVGLISAVALAGPASGSAASGSHPQRGAHRVPALIAGHAASPVLRAMKVPRGRFDVDRTTAGRGSGEAPLRNRRRYRVLIVDGDNLSPHRMRRRLRRFADSGRWVLALDADRGHFRKALRFATGFRALSDSRAFLFRRVVAGGSAHVQMVAAPQLLPEGGGKLGRKQRRRLRRREATRLATLIHRRIRPRPGARSSAAPGSGAVPAELQHVHWEYQVVGSTKMPDPYWTYAAAPVFRVPKPGSQTVTWAMTHNFDVYLDNGGGRPQGNHQVVAYSLDGEVTPKESGQDFAQMYNHFKVGLNPSLNLERAWWTSQVGSSVEPDARTDANLIWQASNPETPNEETEYKSGDEFEVGFSGSKEGAEVEASYKVSNETTRKIPDWGVENETSGNNLEWVLSSRSCDPRPHHYSESGCFDHHKFEVTPLLPPELSRGQVQIHTNGRWKTRELLPVGRGALKFALSTPITLADTYCYEWAIGDVSCAPSKRKYRLKTVTPKVEHVSFDVAAVLPIPIKQLQLSPNPVDGAKNEEAVGTIVLSRPAAMDTSVLVYSDSPNASVGVPGAGKSEATVRIPKGSAEATFKVKTNDNGLRRGQHTTADITAFYAEPTTAQLRVESPRR